jgi:hypothetical protein
MSPLLDADLISLITFWHLATPKVLTDTVLSFALTLPISAEKLKKQETQIVNNLNMLCLPQH